MTDYKESYGKWSGRPEGNKPNYDNCCAEIPRAKGAYIMKQCERRKGYGPNGNYCKQHGTAADKRKRLSNRTD